jgi:hypothetical protein
MNLEDIEPTDLARIGEFDFTIDATRSKQRRIQYIDAVGRHQNFDIVCAKQ